MKSRTFYKLSADKLRNFLPVNPCYDDNVEDKPPDATAQGQEPLDSGGTGWMSDG